MEATIVAVATAVGQGGIGIIRLSGESAIEKAKKAFSKDIEPIHRLMEYGHILDSKGEIIDEVMISFMMAPETYTVENMVEIYTHGGRMPMIKVFERMLELGCVAAEAGEFTKRAFLNGRIDLTEAEAVQDLVSAKTQSAYQQSLYALDGRISKKIKPVYDKALSLLSITEMALSFSDDLDEEPEGLTEMMEELILDINNLIKEADRGKIIKDGIKTLIVGKPNVGKSSLFNLLMDENRALVTDIPGTTRDTIEEMIEFNGLSLNMIDTAGIRDTDDIIERMGIKRAKELVETADIVLWVLDGDSPFENDDKNIKELIKDKKTIGIINKKDIADNKNIKAIEKEIKELPNILLSAKDGEGVNELIEEIKSVFSLEKIDEQYSSLITNIRHQNALKDAKKYLINGKSEYENGMPLDCIEVDLRIAWEKLGEITGETVHEDIIDRIFADFCIGK